MWALARIGHGMAPELLEAVRTHNCLPLRVVSMNCQNLANTLWALGVMGVDPGEGMTTALGQQIAARANSSLLRAGRGRAGGPEANMTGKRIAAGGPEPTMAGGDGKGGGEVGADVSSFSEQNVVSMVMAVARLRMPPGHTMVKALLEEAGNRLGKTLDPSCSAVQTMRILTSETRVLLEQVRQV